jgi:hypothetical protein
MWLALFEKVTNTIFIANFTFNLACPKLPENGG